MFSAYKLTVGLRIKTITKSIEIISIAIEKNIHDCQLFYMSFCKYYHNPQILVLKEQGL